MFQKIIFGICAFLLWTTAAAQDNIISAVKNPQRRVVCAPNAAAMTFLPFYPREDRRPVVLLPEVLAQVVHGHHLQALPRRALHLAEDALRGVGTIARMTIRGVATCV